ncbi:unnamed protein product [Chilo suppressalis]|uniref:Tetraspanin n=1 Tax=Chilo suppressalis TaxID=168631 RepID=A0ABN8B5L6_CHISP|nr:unnamed protein product [Chilo suppressalis]
MHTVGLPRTCLGFTNILFFVFGFIGFGVCLWCAVNTQFFEDVNYTITKSSMVSDIAEFVNLKLWYTPMTTILMILAILTMMTSCCGILSAGCQLKCAVKSYIFLVTIISSVAFWVFFISGTYNIYTKNENTRSYFEKTIKYNYGMENDVITYFWNYLMMEYECCGANSYKDFADSNWQKKSNKLYPVQCCKLENRTALTPISKECTQSVDPSIQTNAEIGCFDLLSKAIASNKGKLIFYVVLSVVSYLVLILFAYCVIRGEPLLGALAGSWELPASKAENPHTEPVPVRSYAQNISYTEEPPKKVVRVISAVNPFQTYKFTPNAYGGDVY